MYGIVEVAGHQYQMNVGKIVDVELLEAEVGKIMELDKVLFIGGESPQLGRPFVSGAKVQVKVLKHDRGDKVLVLKRRPGKYVKKRGHRQDYTALLVTSITDANGKTVSVETK